MSDLNTACCFCMAIEEFRVEKKDPIFANVFLSLLSGECTTNTGLLLSSCLMLAVLSPDENDKETREKKKRNDKRDSRLVVFVQNLCYNSGGVFLEMLLDLFLLKLNTSFFFFFRGFRLCSGSDQSIWTCSVHFVCGECHNSRHRPSAPACCKGIYSVSDGEVVRRFLKKS